MDIFTRCKSERPNNPKKIVFGSILAIAGVLLLLFNIGIIPYELKYIFFSWASLFLAFGLIYICDRKKRTFGIVLLAISALSYLHHFDISFQFGEIILPVVLIVLGVAIVVRRFTTPKIVCADDNPKKKGTFSDEFIDETNIFSGSERRFVNVAFKGGTISNVFGGSELDLTLANLAPGKNVLEINCVFGGVTIIVPHNWKVSIQVNAVLGAFEDKRYIHSGESEMIANSELIIIGNLVFSGGELKSR